jgi:hypothetical protein
VEAILDLVTQGRLRTYGGRASNPFLRSAEVAAVASELGLGTSDAAEPRRVKSPSARVQQRITADSRWADVTDEDLLDWARRADESRRQAARKAAATALNRLQTLLRVLDSEQR